MPAIGDLRFELLAKTGPFVPTYNQLMRPRLGISACLLGEPVRFDGGHKRDAYIVEVLGAHVTWVPVCPEVEAGFGTPRETMRLLSIGRPGRDESGVRPPERVALVVHKTGEDVTTVMRAFAGPKVDSLAQSNLSGFVLKKDSPSCGMERVKVYGSSGTAQRTGRGIFAAALLARMPNLPVEEEGRLCDPVLRENFVERVFAYQRVRRLFESAWTLGDLVSFHAAHKLTLMAHSPSAYQAMGRLVASAQPRSRRAVADTYESTFMKALTTIATPKRHANVLQHMLGYFKRSLDGDSRNELLGLIEDHRAGHVPLIVPLTLFRHHVRRLNVQYLAGQVYLEPHPRELSLRNHV
jgi:uncharacterized protein YbgA (DUF1722 family)/uncharacterized protein YbbK (DUF523 family)